MRTDLIATYRIRADAATIEARANALALEQSVEMPLEGVRDSWAREHTVGRVLNIAPLTGERFEVQLALAIETTGFEAGQLMNMLFGNCSLQPDVELHDVALPQALIDAFPGPRFGIAGLRERLGVHRRAFTCTALKPQGLSPEKLAQLAAMFARAGIDVIKDDHGIANQSYSPFAERVSAVQRAVDAVNREEGTRAVYAPTLSGSPLRLIEQARIVKEQGVAMVLACPMLMGIPAFVELAQSHISVPVLAHPALAGASRMAAPLLLGTLFRLFGADASIFPNHGGRFSYSRDTCAGVAGAARREWRTVKPCLPVPAGGMSVERVDEMLAFYGRDVMLLIGGNLLIADDVERRAREFVSRVAAVRHTEVPA